MKDFTVTIGGSRGDEWERICGTRTFPVKSPIPVLANLPGKSEVRVFLVDLDEVEPDILARIKTGLARKFGLSPAEAETEIKEKGIPILDEEVSVMIDHPQKWFG
jgi:hypothetical protein